MKPSDFKMMKYLFGILCLSILISCKTNSKKLVWEENFNGDVLNKAIWNYELGDGCPNLCGWGNNELQPKPKRNFDMVILRLELSYQLEEDFGLRFGC
jgi:hypothetical protein